MSIEGGITSHYSKLITHYFHINVERGNLVSSPGNQAGETARHTVGGAGVRCRKKRMSSCNGVDTDWYQSSDWLHYPVRKEADVRRVCLQSRSDRCFFGREFGESLKVGKQMTVAAWPAGAPTSKYMKKNVYLLKDCRCVSQRLLRKRSSGRSNAFNGF